MKFQFCGGGDCPDWILGEIVSTLSIMSLDNLKILADVVAEKICGNDFDETLIKPLMSPTSVDNSKSAVACIHFLLLNTVCYGVSSIVFKEEIQQLGFPNRHAEIMCEVLDKYYTDIKSHLSNKEFKINELTSVKVLSPTSVDTASHKVLELKVQNELLNGVTQDTTHVLNIDNTQLKVLLDELQLAYSIMEKYNKKSANEEGKQQDDKTEKETQEELAKRLNPKSSPTDIIKNTNCR